MDNYGAPQTALCEIIKISSLGANCRDVTVASAGIARTARPGQFLNIACGEENLLRRPISICSADAEAGTVRFIFEIRGKGTAWLAERRPGEILDIMGPLGRGFSVPAAETGGTVIVGGGIGVFPMLYACAAAGHDTTVLLGFRDAGRVCLESEFRALAPDVRISTDDGSYGRRGYTAELLRERLAERTCTAVLACGPKLMLAAVAEICRRAGVECQVSTEERMACGVGACLVCVCAMKPGGYVRVCRDGPVFNAEEVDFNA